MSYVNGSDRNLFATEVKVEKVGSLLPDDAYRGVAASWWLLGGCYQVILLPLSLPEEACGGRGDLATRLAYSQWQCQWQSWLEESPKLTQVGCHSYCQ